MKIGFKALLTILGKRYGDRLVADELAKWDGRKVDDFKLYFSEVCRRAYNLEREKKLERETISRKFDDQKMIVSATKILDLIKIKDIHKATKIEDKRSALDKRQKFLIRSWKHENKNILHFKE